MNLKIGDNITIINSKSKFYKKGDRGKVKKIIDDKYISICFSKYTPITYKVHIKNIRKEVNNLPIYYYPI